MTIDALIHAGYGYRKQRSVHSAQKGTPLGVSKATSPLSELQIAQIVGSTSRAIVPLLIVTPFCRCSSTQASAHVEHNDIPMAPYISPIECWVEHLVQANLFMLTSFSLSMQGGVRAILIGRVHIISIHI